MSGTSRTKAVFFTKGNFPPELEPSAELELNFVLSKLVGVVDLLDATDLRLEDVLVVKKGVSLFDATFIPASSQIMFGLTTEVVNDQWVVGKAYRKTSIETLLTHVASTAQLGPVRLGEVGLVVPTSYGVGWTVYQRGRSSRTISLLVQGKVPEGTKSPSQQFISRFASVLGKKGLIVDKSPKNWLYDATEKKIHYVDLLLATKGVEVEVRRLFSLLR